MYVMRIRTNLGGLIRCMFYKLGHNTLGFQSHNKGGEVTIFLKVYGIAPLVGIGGYLILNAQFG
jgi:hypothetical protein